MKNIHLITTSQPSRLLCNHTLKSFCFQKEENGMFVNDGKVSGASFWSIEKAKNNGFNPQHTYITNDEVIKDGDWMYYKHFGEDIVCKYDTMNGQNTNVNEHKPFYQKIILTTDQDLDGVQPIDNEFLEWFVNHPSCEEVEIDKNWNYPLDKSWEYKITIPQEEAKQRAKNYMSLKGALEPKQIKCYCGHTTTCDCSPIDEPKQETLEEAAENYGNSIGNKNGTAQFDFIRGAKWQQERMYSEEDMKQFAFECVGKFLSNDDNKVEIKLVDVIIDRLNKHFEQFKKK